METEENYDDIWVRLPKLSIGQSYINFENEVIKINGMHNFADVKYRLTFTDTNNNLYDRDGKWLCELEAGVNHNISGRVWGIPNEGNEFKNIKSELDLKSKLDII
jgi:hypothetical protein